MCVCVCVCSQRERERESARESESERERDREREGIYIERERDRERAREPCNCNDGEPPHIGRRMRDLWRLGLVTSQNKLNQRCSSNCSEVKHTLSNKARKHGNHTNSLHIHNHHAISARRSKIAAHLQRHP